jgi:beta-phosphoglucomutase-like phosphatase (HAD superfamily)
MPGANLAILELLPEYRLAVGSGSQTYQVEQSLKRHGLLRFFHTIVGQDQVLNGKPEPDIYQRVAMLEGVHPSRCFVLEDQPKGVEAAKRAGMKCIAVPNKHLKEEDFSAADLVIPSLGHLTLGVIERMGN